VFEDNTHAWSGDHAVHQSIVKGIFFSNRSIDKEVRMIDIAPSILHAFGIEIPIFMDGKSIFS